MPCRPARVGSRPGRHVTGLAPRPAAARGGRRGRHPGVGRGRARLAAAAEPGRGAVARRHRDQRQDHDRADARPRSCGPRGCARAAPATWARRCSRPSWTPSPTTSSPSSCRASSCTGRTRSRPRAAAVPQRRPRPRRLARLARRVRRRQGQGLRQHRGRLRLQRAGPAHRRLVEDADVQEGCRAIGFTLGTPAPSQVGVVDDVLADRAFVEQRLTAAAELATFDDLRGDAPSPAPHMVANALAAAALARAHGVPAGAVRAGLRAFVPEPHRIAEVGTVDGVRWVDDSKATNPHAAARQPGRLRARRVGRRRPAQGRRRRRAGGRRRRPAARCGAHRPRPRPDRRGTRPTRAGCPGRRPSTAPTLEPWTWW